MIYIQYYDIFPGFSIISNALYDILKSRNCKLVSTIVDKFNDNDIFILFASFWESIISNKVKNRNIHIILINTETFNIHKHQISIINNIKDVSYNNIIILDYQYKNIEYFNKYNTYCNLLIKYIPFTYNLNKLYNITYDSKKDIDILFYGSPNDRRFNILNKLKAKYNVYHVHFFHSYSTTKSYEEQMSYIRRSKIVLDIFYYENTQFFDYYRLNLLISNKIFFIMENIGNINKDIENNIIDYDKYIISADYNNIINTVDIYMNKSDEERNEISNNIYNWYFSKNNYGDKINNIINILDDN